MRGEGRTERLHYEPLRLEAEAEVVGHGEWRGRPSVILDQSPFYPESGGQMGDHGALDDAPVLDTQIDDAGRVHHVMDAPRPPIGRRIRARVDERRRREHMALHTGQHALSRAVLDLLDATTVSSRLGASACTLDVDVDGLTMDALRPVEDAVNTLIDEDRAVQQRFVDDAELELLALRKPPPDADRIRVVDIAGWDITPCGGTHVTHTAQIELLFIQSVERYKGGSRITFEAGPRARRALRAESETLRAVAAELRCAPPEVGDILESHRSKLDAARAEAGALRAQLAERWAERLEAEGTVVATVDGADRALLEAIADRLAERDRLVALAAPSEDGTDVLIARGPASEVGCGDLLRAVAKASGGRGGGRPDRAQGRLPAGVDWPALVRAALG